MTGPHRLLMTAFGPFPGLPVNPGIEVLARLRDMWRDRVPADLTLETHILPTEYAAVDDWLDGRLAEDPPQLFIMLGYSSIADRLKIEAHASNQCTAHLADVGGFRPQPNAAIHLLPATLPLDAISEALEEAGVDHLRSDDCGEYVCNYIFYHAQERIARMTAPTLSGFVHIPPVDFGGGRVVPLEPQRARPVDEILRGIELVVETAAASLP